ncbi:MAG: prohibitin family protein [Gammaproteobacteria bacterium]|nr:prohibitin family protein [Gammaproteobacteria bacterium]MBU2058707.1 prohibitin family protein [Gammaproteobacteria bacterium]MBU2177172.1 prohibitin family protein [Gammaproteobacteria bacterium]MBU2246411.1 prohibitin family protein [Gammaproteobacteria bacterium]MBU2342602.1 prohibitin family protein [Gammaproteobacteria bacterium]
MRLKIKAFFNSVSAKIEEYLPNIIITCFVLLFLLILFWNRIFITVQAGEGGVLYKRFSGGTVVDELYGEGLHLIYPWNIMAIYNLRVQNELHDLDVLTKEGLKITIKMAIRYHPDRNMVGVLHKYVGQDYFKIVVLPEIEATVRSYVVDDDLTKIYATLATKSTFQEAVNEAIGRVARKFVTVDEVMITDIVLPEQVDKAIQEKLTQQQLAFAYDFRIIREEKEAERKRVEAEGVSRYNTIVNSSLSGNVLLWKGIEATKDIAKSENSKVILIGPDRNSLPIILNAENENFRKGSLQADTNLAEGSQDNAPAAEANQQ